jgi:HK97 family phage major capsid protein
VSSQSPHKTLDVMDKTGQKRVQTMVDDMAQVFVDSVARYRGVSAEKVLKDFGKGDVLIANRAVKAGMIDGVGTFQQTFDALLAKCSGKKHRRSTSAVVDREASLSSFSTYLQQAIARSETGNWSAASGGWHSNIEDMSFTLQHTGLSDGASTTNIVTDAAHNEPVTELEPQPDNSPAATAATEVDNMENENKTAEAVQKERDRVAAVLALGAEWAEYGGNEIAAKAVKDGKSEEDTRREIMDAVKKTKKDEGVITPAAEKVKVGKDREAEAPFASMGEQLCAIAKAGRGGAIDRRLHHLNTQFTAATGHSEAVPSEGGFLLQPTFLGGIEKLMHDIGQVLRRCNMRPIGAGSNALVYNVIDETSRADGSRRGGIRGYWVNEAVAVTKSKLKIRQDRLALEKLGALCYVTEEQLQDTVSLEAEIRESVPEELTFKLEDAIINGTGAGQPLGVLTAAAKVSIDKETGQAAATVLFANISKMWARFWSRSMSSPVAAWFINQDVLTELDNMVLAVGTGGLPAYLPPGGLNDTPYARLKGLPVVPIEYCQTLGTVGDIILADFSQYRVINKGGVQSASSMHVKFEEGETAFRFTYRTNGQPLWESALTPKNGTNTVAPFVVLAERA